jgi:inner membrane protein
MPRYVRPLAVGLILLVDRRIWTEDVPLPIKAAADEAAHLATTLGLLSLLRGRRSRAFYAGAIVGSVALDVDHVPLYAMYEKPSARPGTHSLITVAVVAGVAARAAGRRRRFLQGVTFGLVSHLCRDLLTGGAPLLWPLSGRTVMIGASGLPTLRDRRRPTSQRVPVVS